MVRTIDDGYLLSCSLKSLGVSRDGKKRGGLLQSFFFCLAPESNGLEPLEGINVLTKSHLMPLFGCIVFSLLVATRLKGCFL